MTNDAGPSAPTRTGSGPSPAQRRKAYVPLLKVTLWCGGLLLSLVLGMLSAYLVVSAVWAGSKLYARLRERGRDDGRERAQHS